MPVDPGGGRSQGIIGVTRRPTAREWRRALLLFAVGSVGLVLLLLFLKPAANLLAVGTAAPAIRLSDVDGAQVDVAAAAGGRPYVVEFFEAGCAHCQEVASELCHQGTADVFAVDAAKDSASTVRDYRHRYAGGCSYPLLLDTDLTVARNFAISAVPTVYVVKQGRIAYGGAGLEGVQGLAAALRTALRG